MGQKTSRVVYLLIAEALRKDSIMAPNLTDQCGEENHRIMRELMESAANFVIYQLSCEENNPYGK